MCARHVTCTTFAERCGTPTNTPCWTLGWVLSLPSRLRPRHRLNTHTLRTEPRFITMSRGSPVPLYGELATRSHELGLIAQGAITMRVPPKVMTIVPLIYTHRDPGEITAAVGRTVSVSAKAAIPAAIIPPGLSRTRSEHRQ